MGRGFKGIIFGGLIGAALGVLYAPRSGKITRQKLADKTESLIGEEAQANGTILGEVAKTTKSAVQAGQDIFQEATSGPIGNVTKELQSKSRKIKEAATSQINDFSASSVRPVFSEKNDDLRKRIDDARDKIATQVAKNLNENSQKSVQVEIEEAPQKVETPKKKVTASKANTAKKTVKKSAKKAAKKTVAKKPAAKKPEPKKAAAKKSQTKAAKKTAAKTAAKKTKSSASKSGTKSNAVKPAGKKASAKAKSSGKKTSTKKKTSKQTKATAAKQTKAKTASKTPSKKKKSTKKSSSK